MNGDKELLIYMAENIDMGIEALESMIKQLEKTDNKIKSNVSKSLEMYKAFSKKCKKYLKDVKLSPSKDNLFSVIMAKMGTKMEFMKDNSDSKLADTLIQGYNMGIIDITKKMNKYKDETSKEVMKLAMEYKQMMQEGIENVKGFL